MSFLDIGMNYLKKMVQINERAKIIIPNKTANIFGLTLIRPWGIDLNEGYYRNF